MDSGFRSRKGFALILVFALASIVLLLGLSIVSLTQVETASSRYEQGLRVARANARLALQMALGDLQEFTGPDQRITATADGLRTDGASPVETSFNLPAAGGVEQPFWTGVWDTDNTSDDPVWLVTRPLDAIYTIDDNSDQDADPTETAASGYGTSKDLVKLVGVGSAKPEPVGGDQALHDVMVPKEPLISDSIVGMTASEQATIGHYAYWVGDNGVKASYLLEDQVPETLHDVYGNGGSATYEQIRLEQMLSHRFFLKVDSREVDATDSRLGSIVSELALRLEEDSSGISFLGAYTQNDVRRRFHDFTGKSNGLLVDTVRGGLREDLSNIHAVNTTVSAVDDLVNNYLMPYLNVSDFAPTSPTDLTRSYAMAAKNTTFGGGGPTPAIAPVLAGMKLGIRVRAPDLAPGTPSSPIKGQLEMSVKLWNPYTSHIEGAPLILKLENGDVAAGFIGFNYRNGVYTGSAFPGAGSMTIHQLMNEVSEFRIEAPPSDEWWAPGEIRSFIGVLDPADATYPTTVVLLPSTASPIDEPSKYYTITGIGMTYTSEAVAPEEPGDVGDTIRYQIPAWSPEMTLKTAGGQVIAAYTLNGVGYQDVGESDALSAVTDANPNIAYVWELDSPLNALTRWDSFDPRAGELDGTLLGSSFTDDFQFAGTLSALSHTFQSSSTEIMGYNIDPSVESNVKNNIPLFELPRQDFLSLGGLQMAEFPSKIRAHLGASSASISPVASVNEIFDRFFLSTVPQSGTTTWTVADPLPNSRMEVAGGVTNAALQDPGSAEHLYLNGAFNLNSTSVEAWTAILKGVRLGTWAYDDPAGSSPVGGQSELDVSNENQFLRFSQSAEETWRGAYGVDDNDTARKFIRQGLRSLTDSQVESMATEIVREIRTRRQAASGKVGPYVSLQDFIDEGVIETAIVSAGINSGIVVDTDPMTFTSSFLTQQDVLTAIAPFLSARSDTFLVRAYGDSVNPFDSTEILARAYCEAIVQRVHQKHPSESNAFTLLPTDNVAGAYGRQYRIIAFRWISGDEI